MHAAPARRLRRGIVVAVLSEHSREIGFSPEEIGARVTAILTAAEREAREIIEAARRDASHPASRGSPEPQAPPDGAAIQSLAGLTRGLEALGVRISALERRLEDLWQAIAPATEQAFGTVSASRGSEAGTAVTRAERLRAVDLALRGFSRVQIAAELRSTLPEAQIAQLLDDVLESA
jgi:hypothetical protein